MVSVDKEKAIKEILELFEYQLSMLMRMDKIEKMAVRKRIRDVVLPTIRIHSRQPKVIMEIMEDRLGDVIRLFYDEMEFKRKLARKIDQTLKIR